MASGMIREFLESSTIHGLVQISTSSTRSLRAIWVIIVIACFSIAIHMIESSYKEWQESPVSTTITTHPITELQFPDVTVCPPRGTNTAVNQVVEKVKNANITERERQELVKMSKEVFFENLTKRHARQMSEPLSPENMRSIVNKHSSLPSINKYNGMITLKSNEPEGNFGFGDLECKRDQHHSLHYVVEFPADIGDAIGDGDLVISVQTKDEWSYSWNRTMQHYKQRLNMTDAEDFCKSQGKHLVSITSDEEEKELSSTVEYNYWGSAWLGGERNFEEQKPWRWIDGRKWGFEGKWLPYGSKNGDCLSASEKDVSQWGPNKCNERHSFVCLDASISASGEKGFTLKKKSFLPSSFHVWWDFSPTMNAREGCSGIQISWRIENGTFGRREFVSSELSGTVSTPGLGSPLNDSHLMKKHEYTAVINLPLNISDILDDGALVVDIDVTISQPDSRVQLWSSDFSKQRAKSWGGAEIVCMMEGGHLPSIGSSFQWQKVQDYLAEQGLTSAWLGGSDKRREGEWFWSDGRKWSFTHWAPGQPDNKGLDEDCLITENGTWMDASCDSWNVPVICEVPKLVNIESDTQLIFTRENISKPVLQLTWTSENSEADKRSIGGFKLTWKVRQHNASLERARKDETSREISDDWNLATFEHSEDRNWHLVVLINLAAELKRKNTTMEEAEVWTILLKNKAAFQHSLSCLLYTSDAADE